MAAYYNEWDKDTAQWLRELIKRGLIPDGYVDDRSIVDVHPDDLKEFTQCHFFAGIAGWPLALRLAGWPDDRPVWTGSPPCQPFSVAGKGLAQDDPRHLAPTFLRLIRECRPVRIFGEQVAAAIGKHWLDDLFTELEGQGYTCGAAVLPACSVGAPHKRDRLFFGAQQLADTNGNRHPQPVRRGVTTSSGVQGLNREGITSSRQPGGTGEPILCMAYTNDARPQRRDGMYERTDKQPAGARSVEGGLAKPHSEQQRQGCRARKRTNYVSEGRKQDTAASTGFCGDNAANPHHGFWSDADWLGFRDGKLRPVEPGSFPLANGIPARVGRLRGYGNAIVPPLAAEFILSFEEAIEDLIGSGRADLDELI